MSEFGRCYGMFDRFRTWRSACYLWSAGVSSTERRTQIPESAIRGELDRILASTEFRSSKRSQDFLRYIVEHALNGQAGTLKERTIGIEVFGRPVSYEPSEDATVRVKAGEVRKRLGLYYAQLGATDPIRIELPGGTYVPEFRTTQVEPNSIAPAVTVVTTSSRRREVLLVGALIAFAIAAALVVVWQSRNPNDALEKFWAPVMHTGGPVSICAAYVPVYSLDDGKISPKPEDFTLLTDQFVGGGDLIAVSRLSALFTRSRQPYRVRIGSEISFRDLRSGPAILVGFAYTRWKDISSAMRLFIDASRQPVSITDNGAPTKWALANLPRDRHTTEDYAIVSRVFHPDTHAMLIEIAGITQYGTDAGSDLLTNADLLADALKTAPRSWPGKNLQLVLHVKVVNGSPSSPRVLATHFW